MKKSIFCWSGGKDSAYALHKVQQEGEYEICYLLTTVNATYRRVSMHGVREQLLEKQAESIGIPLLKVYVSESTNAEYEQQMEKILLKTKLEGIEQVIFGDIFLEDLRKYREINLEKVAMQAVFPLWKQNTSFLVQDFIEKGFQSIVCCVNDAHLGEEHVGQAISKEFIKRLPINVDPCGENGEFHTFCYAGPIYKSPISVSTGEKIYKPLDVKHSTDCDLPDTLTTKGFWFCELTP